MSRKTVKFELGHRNFKSKQLSAFHAYEVLFGNDGDVSPEELLQDTYIEAGSGWIRLDSEDIINEHIFHPANLESPLSMLTRLMDKIRRESCGCMYEWNHVKVPRRFLSDAATVESPRGMPILSTLYTEKLATLQELQDFYSLDDALRMYDDFTVQNINKALSQEKAMSESRAKK
jgi:hypothetical protein